MNSSSPTTRNSERNKSNHSNNKLNNSIANSSSIINWKNINDENEQQSIAAHISKICTQVQKKTNNEKQRRLEIVLAQSRDHILAMAMVQQSKQGIQGRQGRQVKQLVSSMMKNQDNDHNLVVFPRLPTAMHVDVETESIQTQPANNNSTTNTSSSNNINAVNIKYRRHKMFKINQFLQPLYIETTTNSNNSSTNTSKPLSTSTIFLKQHYSVPDQKELTFLPYFGDKDTDENIEDVKDLFDLQKREMMVEYGPEYKREYMDCLVRDILEKIVVDFDIDLKKKMMMVKNFHEDQDNGLDSIMFNICRKIARIMDIDVMKVYEVYQRFFTSSTMSSSSSVPTIETTKNDDKNSLSDNDNNIISTDHGTMEQANVLPDTTTTTTANEYDDHSSSSTTASSTRTNNLVFKRPKNSDIITTDYLHSNSITTTTSSSTNNTNSNMNKKTTTTCTTNNTTKNTNRPSSISISSVSHRSNTNTIHNINNENKHRTSYTDAMDSYRFLFCRQCFVYDCNIHGNLPKPNLRIQTELAIQKEIAINKNNGNESSPSSTMEHCRNDIGRTTLSRSNHGMKKLKSSSSRNFNDKTISSICHPCNDKDDNDDDDNTNNIEKGNKNKLNFLSPLHKVIFEHAYQIFCGDTQKLASIFQTTIKEITNFIKKENITIHSYIQVHLNKNKILDNIQQPKKKKMKLSDNKTMKHYNLTWLKRFKDTEIHPAFYPCVHDGPCSEETCTCVQNAMFCTKHCVWSHQSRNMFRGCNCKNGQCQTNACQCFAANRECDPDLCHNCQAGTDPPNCLATKQRCRNDNISMRRHCHLLLAQSGMKNAGWGIYNKHYLKRGNFVHEYIGELISQEEAERRGVLYDKMNRSYLFNVTSDTVIDASRKGNKMKFANHSSTPNCYAKVLTVNGDSRVGLFAKEDIEPQTELLFDYAYDISMSNDLIEKKAMVFDWMKSSQLGKGANKKHA